MPWSDFGSWRHGEMEMPFIFSVLAIVWICLGVGYLIQEGLARRFFPVVLAKSLCNILGGAACLYFKNPLYWVLGMGLSLCGSLVARKSRKRRARGGSKARQKRRRRK